MIQKSKATFTTVSFTPEAVENSIGGLLDYCEDGRTFLSYDRSYK